VVGVADGRVLVACREPVVDVRERPALVLEELRLVPREATLVADDPPPTVHADDQRDRVAVVVRRRQVQVEREEPRLDAVDVVVLDVTDDLG